MSTDCEAILAESLPPPPHIDHEKTMDKLVTRLPVSILNKLSLAPAHPTNRLTKLHTLVALLALFAILLFGWSCTLNYLDRKVEDASPALYSRCYNGYPERLGRLSWWMVLHGPIDVTITWVYENVYALLGAAVSSVGIGLALAALGPVLEEIRVSSDLERARWHAAESFLEMCRKSKVCIIPCPTSDRNVRLIAMSRTTRLLRYTVRLLPKSSRRLSHPQAPWHGLTGLSMMLLATLNAVPQR